MRHSLRGTTRELKALHVNHTTTVQMTGMDISIDEHTLRIIEGALSFIRKSDDPVSTEKPWILGDQADVSKLSFHDICSLDSALDSTKLVFHQLEATKNALFLLARSCEQRLSTLKAKMQPYFLHSGILSLPDNVLALIFESTHFVGDPYILAEHYISHVCRRFRSISLGLPNLWSHVTSRMSKEWVEIRLLRSKTTGLAVDIYDNTWCDCITHFAQQVIPHAHRWQSFRLVTGDIPTSYRRFDRNLQQQFANLQLPTLTFLEVSLDASILDDYIDFNNFKFYKSWWMPELRHADMMHHIPSDALHSSKTISTFDFTFSSDFSELDIQKLMDFLSSLDNLTELSLRFMDYANHDSDLTDHIVLPRVKSFRLTTLINDALEVMMTSVRMPALTKLYLDIREIDDFSVLINLEEYASVKDLTFASRGYALSAFDLGTIFAKFPNMENLTLNTPNLRPYISLHSSSLPSLQSLSLMHNANIDSSLVQNLVEWFKTKGAWNGFKTLEIRNDCLLVREEIEEIVTKEKLKWL